MVPSRSLSDPWPPRRRIVPGVVGLLWHDGPWEANSPGMNTFAVVHTRQFHNVPGGRTVGQTPKGQGGVRGRGVSHEGSTPSEGGEQQRPGSNPGICFSLPNRTPPTCTPRCAMVVPRPPIGRALGATIVHPPLVSAVLAVCRANTGRRGGPLRSEFASEGAPGFAMSVGDMTGPGVDEDLAS
jgi:hypothetical protein